MIRWTRLDPEEGWFFTLDDFELVVKVKRTGLTWRASLEIHGEQLWHGPARGTSYRAKQDARDELRRMVSAATFVLWPHVEARK